MCEAAMRVERALYTLRIALADAIDLSVNNQDALDFLDLSPLRARNILRHRAGLDELPIDTNIQGRRRLSLCGEEHLQLGCDLKFVHGAIVAVECTIGNTCGKTSPLRRCVKGAVRKLLTLRGKLDDIVCNDFPSGTGGRRPAQIYFGANDPALARVSH